MSLGSVFLSLSTSYANGLGSLPELAPRASRTEAAKDPLVTARTPAPRAVRSRKWRRVMAGFRLFISTFLLSVLGGERGRESATDKDTAAAANALIHATLSCERPGQSWQPGASGLP